MMFPSDTRAVSIAVNHVLAIGITTVLVVGLLTGAGTMLENEREASAEASLETVGERLAEEISTVDRYANGGNGSNTTVEETDLIVSTDHDRRVSGTRYTVDFHDDPDDCGQVIQETGCLALSAQDEDVDVFVPIEVESDIETEDDDPVAGGSIEIRYDSTFADGEAIILSEGDS